MGNYKGNVYLWRLQGGTAGDQAELVPVALIRAHSGSSGGGYITKVLISPDAKKLATASSDGSIKIWSTSTFALLQTLIGHSKWVWDVAFSADSAYVISASSDHTAKLWDLASGEVVRTYAGHEKAITALAMNDFVEVG
jgi:G protein beta subunit-like protein